MPWTVTDVESHIKGLTDKQKEQWVAVANSALSKCKSEDGKDCEASAIRQANSVVQKDLTVFKKDREKQIVYGILFEPDYVDAQGDFVSKEDIEEAAHNYLLTSRTIKFSHQEDISDQVSVVESYIAPVDFEMNGMSIKEGTWIVALKIWSEELWNATENQIVGLSPGGYLTA